jgi:hypothetical protein
MNQKIEAILSWTPRILALGFAFFLSMFVLEYFNQGYSITELAVAIFMQLIPAEIIIIFTIMSWKKPGLGAILFFIVGTVYIIMTKDIPLATYFIISGPIYLIALLFLINSIYINQTTKPQNDQRP